MLQNICRKPIFRKYQQHSFSQQVFSELRLFDGQTQLMPSANGRVNNIVRRSFASRGDNTYPDKRNMSFSFGTDGAFQTGMTSTNQAVLKQKKDHTQINPKKDINNHPMATQGSLEAPMDSNVGAIKELCRLSVQTTLSGQQLIEQDSKSVHITSLQAGEKITISVTFPKEIMSNDLRVAVVKRSGGRGTGTTESAFSNYYKFKLQRNLANTSESIINGIPCISGSLTITTPMTTGTTDSPIVYQIRITDYTQRTESGDDGKGSPTVWAASPSFTLFKDDQVVNADSLSSSLSSSSSSSSVVMSGTATTTAVVDAGSASATNANENLQQTAANTKPATEMTTIINSNSNNNISRNISHDDAAPLVPSTVRQPDVELRPLVKPSSLPPSTSKQSKHQQQKQKKQQKKKKEGDNSSSNKLSNVAHKVMLDDDKLPVKSVKRGIGPLAVSVVITDEVQSTAELSAKLFGRNGVNNTTTTITSGVNSSRNRRDRTNVLPEWYESNIHSTSSDNSQHPQQQSDLYQDVVPAQKQQRYQQRTSADTVGALSTLHTEEAVTTVDGDSTCDELQHEEEVCEGETDDVVVRHATSGLPQHYLDIISRLIHDEMTDLVTASKKAGTQPFTTSGLSDPNLQCLSVAVQYWANRRGIVGTNPDGTYRNNEDMHQMVLDFLKVYNMSHGTQPASIAELLMDFFRHHAITSTTADSSEVMKSEFERAHSLTYQIKTLKTVGLESSNGGGGDESERVHGGGFSVKSNTAAVSPLDYFDVLCDNE